MTKFKFRLLATICLLGTFIGFFLLTTIVFDFYCRASGYYAEGIYESQEVGK